MPRPALLAAAVAAALVAATGAVLAAAPAPPVSDPQIAYTKSAGRSTYIYLANADGKSAVKVATVSGMVDRVDWSPLGTRLAFSDERGIWLIDLELSAAGVTAGAPRLLVARGSLPDWSDDGTRLIYRDEDSNTVRAIAATGGAPKVLLADNCQVPRWLRSADLGNAFTCRKIVGGQQVSYQIWTVLLDANDQVTSLGPVFSTAGTPYSLLSEEMDVARTRNAVVMVTDYPEFPSLLELNLETGAVTPRGAGRKAHFNRDDARLVYVTPHTNTGTYVSSRHLLSNETTALTKKGEFGPTDARP